MINRVAIDDNILMKDKVSTAGSKILYNFRPPFNAAVIDKLTEAGVKDIRQTKPNEFGISLTGPFGCVESVAKGEADIGIGCDVNGSVRREASKNGICFIKPAYGTVSRFGLVSASPSMEQIGIACRDISQGFECLSVISRADAGAAGPDTDACAAGAAGAGPAGIKIGVPACCADLPEIRDAVNNLNAMGVAVSVFDFSMLKYVPGAAYIISAAETGGNISRFDGIKFGYRTESYSNLEDVYVNSRTEGFTFETKLFALMGNLVLTKENFGKYYNQSLKIRRLIKENTDEILTRYDAVMTPVKYRKAGDGNSDESFFDAYENLKYPALPNLTGNPAISLPGGVEFMAGSCSMNILFRIGECFQKNTEAAL